MEADIEVEFDAPKDYKEAPAPTLKKRESEFAREQEEKDATKLKELEGKYVRIDGKKLTQKQKKDLLAKVKEEEKSKEQPDFDPRKHRLVHGIRDYSENGVFGVNSFQGQGIKLK